MEEEKIAEEEIIDDINVRLGDEVCEEIFSRLPCKSRYRAKCVSKTWNNLISAATELRRRRPLLTTSGLFYGETFVRVKWNYASFSSRDDGGGDKPHQSGSGFSLDFLPGHKEETLMIENTHNGLVLCSNRITINGPSDRVDITHYLCNPLTKEWIVVDQRVIPCNTSSAALVFDPLKSTFKIILFLLISHELKTEVLCSETDRGKQILLHFAAGGEKLSLVEPVYPPAREKRVEGNRRRPPFHQRRSATPVAGDLETGGLVRREMGTQSPSRNNI
ncbi:hypothetical protein H6P81_004872 [Aristolochia fimbriata]|uniref:F-box domain-containing protein n=1 Tax=Aristolochia fimbriata TaxID=158543 RepID=A0AAV7EXD4_ARIFI|nr:hypothetical protein H6P81_004872 [Aristolochia fimbriata]